ncbi:MAG: hypothetical protein IPO16_12885 [Saprospiraceae bacterium]|nr:hypothetical protein [Saprospiraceae bacterium]
MKENVALVVKNAGNSINTPESQNSPASDPAGIYILVRFKVKQLKKKKKIKNLKTMQVIFQRSIIVAILKERLVKSS